MQNGCLTTCCLLCNVTNFVPHIDVTLGTGAKQKLKIPADFADQNRVEWDRKLVKRDRDRIPKYKMIKVINGN